MRQLNGWLLSFAVSVHWEFVYTSAAACSEEHRPKHALPTWACWHSPDPEALSEAAPYSAWPPALKFFTIMGQRDSAQYKPQPAVVISRWVWSTTADLGGQDLFNAYYFWLTLSRPWSLISDYCLYCNKFAWVHFSNKFIKTLNKITQRSEEVREWAVIRFLIYSFSSYHLLSCHKWKWLEELYLKGLNP